MELVVAFVSALIGLSAAFFLSVSFYDMRVEGWTRLRQASRPAGFDALAGGRHPLIPRTIRQTPLE